MNLSQYWIWQKFMYLYLIKIPKLFPFPSGGFWSQKSENLLNDLIIKTVQNIQIL